MTINEEKDRKVSVHTWKKHVPEILKIAKEHNFVYSKPCEKKVKEKYNVFKKYGMCEYEDASQECFPDVYFVVYFPQHKNVGRLQEIFDTYKNYGWKGPKSVHYKYNKDHIKTVKVEYLLPSVKIENRYPIYVLSLGRYSDVSFPKGTCMTLEEMGLEYTLVLMTHEVPKYVETLQKYNCQNCMNIIHLEDNQGLGGTPQRNLAWDDAKKRGYEKHWILDDNIDGYYWFNQRKQIQIKSGVVFRNIEDVVDNIKEKIGLAAHNYRYDARDTELRPPIIVNGKTFSSILVNHTLLDMCNIKWRLKYNEDIDLGLQTLTTGLMTLGFDTFVSNKMPSLKNKEGGNREIYSNYKKEGFTKKLECLMKQWRHLEGLVKPSTKKLNKEEERDHHNVDWDRFKPQDNNGKIIRQVDILLTPKKIYTNWEWYGIQKKIS